MSGASEAETALRDAVAAPMAAVAAAVSMARGAQAELRNAKDLLPAMIAIADLALAMETLAGHAEAAEKMARHILARTMAETGATTIQTPSHTVSLREASRLPRIIDADALPPELIHTPAPRPDLNEIGKRLRRGETVPGAEISNGGDPVISFRAHEKRSAA